MSLGTRVGEGIGMTPLARAAFAISYKREKFWHLSPRYAYSSRSLAGNDSPQDATLKMRDTCA